MTGEGGGGEVLGEEARRTLYDVLAEARSTVDAEPIVSAEGDRLRDLFSKAEPVVAALVAQARADGVAEERERTKILDDAFAHVATKYTYAPGPGGNIERIAYLGAADMAPALAEWIRQRYRALDKAREEYR